MRRNKFAFQSGLLADCGRSLGGDNFSRVPPQLTAKMKLPPMKRFRPPGARKQIKPVHPTETSLSTADNPPLRAARISAIGHIHDAAEIISSAMPYVAEIDKQLYCAIVGGLNSLERHLTDLHQSEL